MSIASALQGWNAPAAVTKAVQNASVKTGIDFSYLMQKASQESSFKADAKATTSSATGLYQFIEKTWLKMVKDHGADYGLKNYSDKIDSNLSVSDPATKKAILDLRKDPSVSALMAAEFTKDNKDYLQDKVGGKIGQTELYFAHFMGAGGAEKFLNALKANPDQLASTIFPKEAAANKGVFYKDGQSLSLQQIYNRFASKFDEAPKVFTPIADQDMPQSESSKIAATVNSIMGLGGLNFDNFSSHSSNPNLASIPDLDVIFNQTKAQNAAFLTSLIAAQMDNPLDHRNDQNHAQSKITAGTAVSVGL